jgi:ribose 1,5-bisphosphate isomerase
MVVETYKIIMCAHSKYDSERRVLMEKVREAEDKIRGLKVQGATNVAITAVRALADQIEESKTFERESILLNINEAKAILFGSRETEPFMRNAIRYMEWKIRKVVWNNRKELMNLVKKVEGDILNDFSDARQTLIEVGSKRVLPNSLIMTHCHSSAVASVLKESKKQGIDFQVICTESRPVFQGRITAKELIELGIETTMIVDSAIRSFINEVDLVLVGADAITSEGNVINKIGTSQVALAANEARVPFYVVTELLKFDPQTIHGDYEVIEERSISEVWSEAPSGLLIRNPAFDVTRRDYIHGLICEEGVISPHTVLEAVHRRYPWIVGFES